MRSKALQAFAAVLAAAALLQAFALPGGWIAPSVYWLAVVLLAAGAAALAGRRGEKGALDLFGSAGGEFLCDRCRFNDARYCSRPERPNATRCPDYKGR